MNAASTLSCVAALLSRSAWALELQDLAFVSVANECARAVSPSVALPGLLHELIDCSVAARRAGAGIEMNSSTHRRKHAHNIQWDNRIMNDYIRVAVFIVMPALLLGLPLCM